MAIIKGTLDVERSRFSEVTAWICKLMVFEGVDPVVDSGAGGADGI